MLRRIQDITHTVKDLDEAIRFYETLGFQKKFRFKDYAGFDCAGVEIGLKTWGECEPPRAGEPCINFFVDDVDEAYRELKKKGVIFTKGPYDTPGGGRIANFTYPDGNSLQITQIDWEKYYKCAAK